MKKIFLSLVLLFLSVGLYAQDHKVGVGFDFADFDDVQLIYGHGKNNFYLGLDTLNFGDVFSLTIGYGQLFEIHDFGIKEGSLTLDVGGDFYLPMLFGNNSNWVSVYLGPTAQIGYQLSMIPLETFFKFSLGPKFNFSNSFNVDFAFSAMLGLQLVF